MNYLETVQALEARGMMPERAPSLEPMHQGLRELGFEKFPFRARLLRDPCRCILVAGTNGKGSVCATLEALLTSAGERVGLYTSPHLIRTTERIRLAGQDIPEEHFCEAYRQVESRTRSLQLSYFEMLTLMAVWYFTSGEAVPVADRIILEVGLGGLWDATNAVPHGMAIITSIGKDHENLLGGTLAEIAENKFGVIQPRTDFLPEGMKVIHLPLQPEILPVAARIRHDTGSNWKEVSALAHRVDSSSSRPKDFIRTPWGDAELALPGSRGAQNTSLALRAFEELGFEPSRYLGVLKEVNWPGRMEEVTHPASPCSLYLSGDHNPEGAASLVDLLRHFPRQRIHLLVGISKDKDHAGILDPLFGIPDSAVYLTETPFRGRKLADYGSHLKRAQGAWSDPEAALENIFKQAAASDLIVVTGSLYLIGKIRSLPEIRPVRGSSSR